MKLHLVTHPHTGNIGKAPRESKTARVLQLFGNLPSSGNLHWGPWVGETELSNLPTTRNYLWGPGDWKPMLSILHSSENQNWGPQGLQVCTQQSAHTKAPTLRSKENGSMCSETSGHPGNHSKVMGTGKLCPVIFPKPRTIGEAPGDWEAALSEQSTLSNLLWGQWRLGISTQWPVVSQEHSVWPMGTGNTVPADLPHLGSISDSCGD